MENPAFYGFYGFYPFLLQIYYDGVPLKKERAFYLFLPDILQRCSSEKARFLPFRALGRRVYLNRNRLHHQW